MSKTTKNADDSRTYFVYGSGLMAVPFHRMNDVPRMKLEFHADEVRRAMIAARTRKLA